MNVFRKLLGLLMAVVFVGFALPGVADAQTPQKSYSIEFVLPPTDVNGNPNPNYDPNTSQVIPPVTVQVTLKNESPPSGGANSNIGSFQFQVVGLTIVRVLPPPSGSVSVNNNVVSVKNMGPLQAQQTFTLTLLVGSCGDGTLGSIGVFTGSQLNGQTFTQFGGDTTFPTALQLSTPLPALQPTGISCGPVACASGLFTVPTSAIDCSANPNSAYCITGQRFPDKIGGCTGSASFNYFVANMLPFQGPVHFRWDVDLYPFAVLYYKLNSPTKPTPAVGWLNASNQPADGLDPTLVPANVVLIRPAPACLSAKFPAPYGMLAAPVGNSDLTIQVSLSIPNGKLPKVPFPIVIGDSAIPERMVVTQTSGNGTWNVNRCDGGTCDPSSPPSHIAGLNVVSTPLPILPATLSDGSALPPPYVAGDQAQMCVAVPPAKNNDGTWSTWFFDIGDGWGNY